MSTEAFGSVTYSPPTMLQSKASSSKSDILNILENNMDRRTLFYFGKLFLESIKSGDKFQNLKRTITINLMNLNFLPLEPFHSTFHLYEDYRRDYMLTDLIELHFIEFPKFRAMQHNLHDPLHRWLLFMEENLTEEQLEELIQMDPMIKKPRSGWNESRKHFRFNQVAA
ncbi:Rpn family recombination-promoting nuclease/putative transposase [Paenibacillus montaniterrae]|nr:Rpn family recombination-promoting nuclease/putative transposase [Paenibacillus montaniterrae]